MYSIKHYVLKQMQSQVTRVQLSRNIIQINYNGFFIHSSPWIKRGYVEIRIITTTLIKQWQQQRANYPLLPSSSPTLFSALLFGSGRKTQLTLSPGLPCFLDMGGVQPMEVESRLDGRKRVRLQYFFLLSSLQIGSFHLLPLL